MSKSKKLVFFGSGPVAAASLQGLIDAGFEVEAVITKPRAVGHKGNVPVLELVDKLKLTAHLTPDKKSLIEIFNRNKFASLVGVVVDYGIIIPKEVISHFPKGIVNSHFSLLPEWRGADPITFALLSGQKDTSVSIMLIDEGLDTGKLLAQADYQISPRENVTELTNNLVELSNRAFAEVLPIYMEDKITLVDQDKEKEPTYSRRLTKEDGNMNLNKPAEQLEREVRAFLGWPKSRIEVLGKPLVVTRARVAESEDDGFLVLKAKPGWLEIQELIGPSGRTMTGADFLRGYSKN